MTEWHLKTVSGQRDAFELAAIFKVPPWLLMGEGEAKLLEGKKNHNK